MDKLLPKINHQSSTRTSTKGGNNMIYEKILKEKLRLEKRIEELQAQIEKLPAGKLICASNRKWQKWYISDGHTSTYLPKKERETAEKLALKKYLIQQLENTIHELKSLNLYLQNHDSTAEQKELSIVTAPEFKDLLEPYFYPLSQELQQWEREPYPRNNNHPEHLIHKTYSGNYVRSKSEALIDMFLFKNHIPFRYECSLELDNVLLYPDFTIRHPKTGKLFYWEHFGLMDQATYRKNACSKLQLYISNGIIPNIQLITTYEMQEEPLDPETVEKIVHHYFL